MFSLFAFSFSSALEKENEVGESIVSGCEELTSWLEFGDLEIWTGVTKAGIKR